MNDSKPGPDAPAKTGNMMPIGHPPFAKGNQLARGTHTARRRFGKKFCIDVQAAYRELGGVDYLVTLGKEQPKAFCALLRHVVILPGGPTQATSPLHVHIEGELVQAVRAMLQQAGQQRIHPDLPILDDMGG